MRRYVVIVLAVCFFCSVVAAEVTVAGVAAVQVTKKNAEYSKGKVDDSWVRGEVKVAGKLESGLSGLVHLRIEPKLTSDPKSVPIQPRQIFLKLPVCMVDLMAGRWYETYGLGNYYFGQYLFGITKNKKGVEIGNGSMNVDYKMIDGFKATVNLAAIRSAFNLAVLPVDSMFQTTSIMAMFGGSPIEGLRYNIAGNFQVIAPKNIDLVHRAMVNCNYTIMKAMNLGIFGEAAIVNFDDVNNNAWFLLGLASKVPVVLDRLQAEFEIKNHRNGDREAVNSLRWMVMVQKKVKDLTFDLNIGTDPAQLDSRTPGEIGAIFRTTAKF